jgi:uncharacterized protein
LVSECAGLALDAARGRAHFACRMTDYHEAWEALPEEARDLHRALTSLKEEIEAVDWYHQRVTASKDAGLRDLLSHNLGEEIEHACMTLEWLRRHMPGWDEQLRRYLFSEGSIVGVEQETTAQAHKESGLSIGSLKGRLE